MTYFDIAADLGYTNRDAIARSNNRYMKRLKSGETVPPTDFIRSEIPAPGSVQLSSVVACLDDPLPHATERLRRMAMSLHYPVEDTIAGYTLQEKDAETLTTWLREYTVIRPTWEAYCNDRMMPVGPAEYHKFLRMIQRKNYTVCKNHPCFFRGVCTGNRGGGVADDPDHLR